MKSSTSKSINAHTSKSKIGMGDSYGSGIRQNVGRVRDSFTIGANMKSNKTYHKPPKSLA